MQHGNAILVADITNYSGLESNRAYIMLQVSMLNKHIYAGEFNSEILSGFVRIAQPKEILVQSQGLEKYL